MKSRMDLHVFQIGQIMVQSRHVLAERLPFLIRDFVRQIRLGYLFPHHVLQGGQVFRLRPGEMDVLVHDFFQFG